MNKASNPSTHSALNPNALPFPVEEGIETFSRERADKLPGQLEALEVGESISKVVRMDESMSLGHMSDRLPFVRDAIAAQLSQAVNRVQKRSDMRFTVERFNAVAISGAVFTGAVVTRLE